MFYNKYFVQKNTHRSKLSFDTIHGKEQQKVYAKRIKVVILMFYMHLVSVADVLIFGSALELKLKFCAQCILRRLLSSASRIKIS
jgi:hypothetical protein